MYTELRISQGCTDVRVELLVSCVAIRHAVNQTLAMQMDRIDVASQSCTVMPVVMYEIMHA